MIMIMTDSCTCTFTLEHVHAQMVNFRTCILSNEKSKQLIEMQLLTHGALLKNRTTNIFVYGGKGVNI